MTFNPARLVFLLGIVAWIPLSMAVPMGSPATPRASVPTPSPAEQAVDAGYKALNQGDLRAAKAAFDDAAKRYPTSALPLLGLAEVARLERQPGPAEQMIKKAVAVDPKSIEAWRALGRLHFTQGKFGEAEGAFKKALSLDPASPSVHIDLGENYLNGMKKYNMAADAYRNAVKLKPAHPGAHLGLAAALALQGDIAGAAAEYHLAAKYDPDSPLSMHRLGMLYAQQRQYAEALKALDAALEVAKRNNAIYVPGLLDRGDVHLAGNDIAKAAADYQAAANAEPKNATALLKLGTVQQLQKKWPDAERSYLAAIQADPRAFAAYNNLAWMAAMRKEKLDDALRWSKQAIELAPDQPALHDTLGAVHRARGEKELAIAAWEKAVATKAPRPTYLYRLGLAYADAGRPKDAIAAFNRSLKAGGDFPEAADAREQLKKLGAGTK